MKLSIHFSPIILCSEILVVTNYVIIGGGSGMRVWCVNTIDLSCAVTDPVFPSARHSVSEHADAVFSVRKKLVSSPGP